MAPAEVVRYGGMASEPTAFVLSRMFTLVAIFTSAAVHFIELPTKRVACAHVSDVMAGAAERLNVTLCETELRLAVSTAVLFEEMIPASAVNVTIVAPEATVTEAGEFNSDELLASATCEPVEGAALFNVTVQVLPAAEGRVVGVHASDDGTTGDTSRIDAVCELPFRDAVIVAV